MKVNIQTQRCIIQPKAIYTTFRKNLKLVVLVTRVGNKIANCLVLDSNDLNIVGNVLDIPYKEHQWNLFNGIITLQNDKTIL